MKIASIWLAVALLGGTALSEARAQCQIDDAKLEQAILIKPDLRGPANRQIVRDLRSLRDAAFALWSYGRHEACEQLLAHIRELIATPTINSLGGNDEEDAEKQINARNPKVQRETSIGRRGEKNVRPLISIEELSPALRTDEIVGAQVRSSDDKIIGEVRNIVLGIKDGHNYLVVASGGFFKPGRDSIVVPMKSLSVSQERDSFFVSIASEQVKSVPIMPDQHYKWLADSAWRERNDALFAGK